MKRIYIAGAYSADNVLEVLGNIRRGISAAVWALLHGYAPFCPWLDFLFFLQNDGKIISVEEIKAYSMAWLEASDEVWVLPDSSASIGTQAEIKRAKELNIPIKDFITIKNGNI